jgi:hypothetical protein
MNLSSALLGCAYCLIWHTGGQHPITLAFQYDLAQVQKRRFVFYQQDGLLTSPDWFGHYFCLHFFYQVDVPRQINTEGRPQIRFAVYIDEAAILFDNAVHRGQTQAGAFPQLFGSKKWFEKMSIMRLMWLKCLSVGAKAMVPMESIKPGIRNVFLLSLSGEMSYFGTCAPIPGMPPKSWTALSTP